MATIRIPILGNSLSLTDNPNWAAYSSYNATVVHDFAAWFFNATATGSLRGQFQVPKNFVAGSTKLIILWTSVTTAGNVVWQAEHRAMLPATSLVDDNTSPAARTDSITTASKPGAADRLETDTITLTDTDWTVDDLVTLTLQRLGADASDTKSDFAAVAGITLEYADA